MSPKTSIARQTAELAVLCALGCAPAPTPAPPPPVSAAPPPVATAPPPVASVEPPPAPPPAPEPKPEGVIPEHVEKPVCTLDAKNWKKNQGATKLQLRPGGPDFAFVEPPTASVEIAPDSTKPSVLVRTSVSGVSLRGFADANEIDLFAKRALTFNGVAIPLAQTALQVRSAASDLELGFVPDKSLRFTTPPARHARCDEVALDPSRFDAWAQIKGNKRTRFADLVPGDVPFSAEPGGPAAVTVSADGNEQVEVLETKGDQSRVLYDPVELVLYGWVPSANIKLKRAGQGYGTGHGMLGRGLPGEYATREAWECGKPVALHARVADESAVVGELAPKTLIVVIGHEGDDRIIALPVSWFIVAKEARVLVRAADLRDCEPK